jgi:hypothetical protein
MTALRRLIWFPHNTTSICESINESIVNTLQCQVILTRALKNSPECTNSGFALGPPSVSQTNKHCSIHPPQLKRNTAGIGAVDLGGAFLLRPGEITTATECHNVRRYGRPCIDTNPFRCCLAGDKRLTNLVYTSLADPILDRDSHVYHTLLLR